jgi:hypothetical protein
VTPELDAGRAATYLAPMYAAGARLVAFAHFLFIALAVVGPFLVAPLPAWIWVQVAIALWSAYVFIADRPCPLTPLENALRRRAGQRAYPTGFVEHYIAGRGLGRRSYVVVGMAVLVWNAALLALLR